LLSLLNGKVFLYLAHLVESKLFRLLNQQVVIVHLGRAILDVDVVLLLEAAHEALLQPRVEVRPTEMGGTVREMGFYWEGSLLDWVVEVALVEVCVGKHELYLKLVNEGGDVPVVLTVVATGRGIAAGEGHLDVGEFIVDVVAAHMEGAVLGTLVLGYVHTPGHLEPPIRYP
jgi:hypothetical protein